MKRFTVGQQGFSPHAYLIPVINGTKLGGTFAVTVLAIGHGGLGQSGVQAGFGDIGSQIPEL